MDNQPSLLRIVLFTLGRVTSFIMGFFLLGGPYYTLLDNFYSVATSQGIAALTTWSLGVYWMFYYGFPSVMVLGVVGSIAYAFMMNRKRYYATEEAFY